ncbi:MAG: rod shape-determining protein MreD [Planctomycetes bacterium]|nr:rod shape-determining protein MreD [Planctomycetota bacterium]NUQ35857.1 rod shape-determining protein MreD [Planctomycetaceae bacterium]
MALYPAAGLILAVISACLLSRISIFGVWPDVISLYALFFALHANERGRYLPCMALGLMRDLLSAGPLGTYAILYGLLYRLLTPHRKSLFRENPLTLALLAGVVVAGINLAHHMSLVLTGAGVGWGTALTRSLLIGLVSAPLMPLLSFMMKWLLGRLGVERLPGGVYNV